MYRYLLPLMVVMFCYSCESSYEDITDYKGYYDDEMKKKKVEGTLYNGEEIGEWIFYSEEGKIIQKGSYDNGLLEGVWEYNLPFLSNEIYWLSIDLDTLIFSVPSTYVKNDRMSKGSNVAYQDSITKTLLGISIVKDCDRECIKNYYDFNLNEFKSKSIEIISSESKYVDSKSGVYYFDKFVFTRSDYPYPIIQYMIYKKLVDGNLLVITLTNKQEHEQILKFLMGEIFYHFKYKHRRVAFPFEEITYLSNG